MGLTNAATTKLRELATENHNAAFVLRHLGTREREYKTIDIYRVRLELIRGGFAISIDDITDIFDQLQRIGVGKLSRRKLPTHSTFQWSEAMQVVAQAALGGQTKDARIPLPSVKSSQTHTIDLYAPIRGRLIHLQLPKDFGVQDARELAAYLEQVAAARSS